MQTMLRRYDDRFAWLQERLDTPGPAQPDRAALCRSLYETLTARLSGSIPCDAFYKAVLDTLTAYADRHLELRLKHLPHMFQFDG